MKFTAKDYQNEAVLDVLDRLRKARKRWHEDGERSAFSLTAATGAGKTVMAADVFEALFHGDDERDFVADPGAVVIWFSDDPSLNEQTHFRLREASDRLNLTDLVIVDNTFNREKFRPGKVYFLNTQKLSRTSLLVRGHEPTADMLPAMRPDLRSHTIWDTIRNTIEDPNLTLYLVLDEAHRGMRQATGGAERSTIVSRLINGHAGVPPIPIVWGISATVERFEEAMRSAEERTQMPVVKVDPQKVQDSGLLKDAIILDVPDEEAGQFDSVLTRRAADKVRELSEAWRTYSAEQAIEPVKPLLVMQVRNTPDHSEIGSLLDIIFQRWPELDAGSVAHVFGDHTSQRFGSYEVPHISPERVQESDWVRVLIAKDAISTGWDCPRAEVMVSFRVARDITNITQLLGRMVRTPLARRIPGNDRLNSVDCLLPFFDRKSVLAVAEELSRGGTDGDNAMPGRRVLINPTEVVPNGDLPAAVWDKFLSLPSQSLPQRAAKPVRRLTALAHELARDGLQPDAGKEAHAAMHKVLDGAAVQFSGEVAQQRSAILTVEGLSLRIELQGEKSLAQFLEEADFAVIEDAFRRSARQISPDLARTYAKHLALSKTAGDKEEALIEAYADIAAIGLVPEIRLRLDDEAKRLAAKWFAEHRVAIASLSDERQEAYRQIQALSDEPQQIDLAQPKSRMVMTEEGYPDGTTVSLPAFRHHLLCDKNGAFPAALNTWEAQVLEAEMDRSGFVAWYRNPSGSSQDSLGVSYRSGDKYGIVRPDFLVFTQISDGSIAVDIVDPHGHHLSDALDKLKGLASYAEQFGDSFRRIDSVAKIDDQLRVLPLKESAVRSAVLSATHAETVFRGVAAQDYQ